MAKVKVVSIAKILILMASIWFSTGLKAASAELMDLSIGRIGDATHLEFTGGAVNHVEMKKKTEGGKTVLSVETAQLTPAALIHLRTYKDDAIEKIVVNPQAVDENTEVKIYLRTSKLDSFDYLSDQPTRWILDIFEKEEGGKTKKNAVADEGKAQKLPAKKASGEKTFKSKAKDSEEVIDESEDVADQWPAEEPKHSSLVELAPWKGKATRNPSSDALLINPDFVDPDNKAEPLPNRGAFDGGDPEYRRFVVQDFEVKEAALIASSANIYIHFPMLKIPLLPLEKLVNTPPLYKVLPLAESGLQAKVNKEQNDEARLLVSLFEKGRFAIFLKTAKTFLKQYPNTPYEEIVRYMMADTFYKFYRESKSATDFETAMNLYRGVSEKFNRSPLTARTHLFVAYSYLERADNLNAIKGFEGFLKLKTEDKNFDQNKLTDQIKIAEAQAYLNLGRLDDAYKILDDVERTAKDKKDSVDAAYHKGDVYFQNGDYKRTVEEYKGAQKRFPADGGHFPNAFFNLAEAQFWLGNYKESLNAYREFLQKFPQDDFGGYAMTRIGELMEVLGVDPKRVRGAYLESSFRYRGSPGADVAKIRLITDRMRDMKETELKDSLQQVDEIEKTVELPSLDEFTTFMIADGFYNRGEYETATQKLIKYYQNNPIAKNREKYKMRIERNIASSMQKSVGEGKFLDVLSIYSRYAKNWLASSDRIDTEVYKGRAYEQAGVYDQAEKIYRDALNSIYALKGTKKEKERNVFEILPTTDQLNLRLAAISDAEKAPSRAIDYLKQIQNPEKLTEEEQVERAEVSATVLEEKNDLVGAKRFLKSLSDTWKGQPVAMAPLYLHLAKIEAREKNYKEAELNLQKVANLHSDSGLVSEDIMANSMELTGDIALEQRKKREAVKAYRDLLTQFEGKRPLSSIRYKVGQILFDLGDLKDAEAAWNELKTDKDDKNGTWFRLASEKMNSSHWKNEYKKYIDRIPAMADGAAPGARQ